ncbi:MAG: hypothetical protein M3P27_03940 [Acidobacteriota bacterium]|nr:hypothetical protein [Acidobacteriota bacterium]
MKPLYPRLSLAPPPRRPLQLTIRFRQLDSDTWQVGRVETGSDGKLVFLSDLPLEIGTLLELALPAAVLAQFGIPLHNTYARVVERVLERWPELSTAITARILAEPAQQMSGAA